MKKKYIPFLLAAITALTPLKAAASSQDWFVLDYVDPAGSGADNGSAENEVQFGDNDAWYADLAENAWLNVWQAEDSSAQEEIPFPDAAEETGESSDEESQTGESESGENADGERQTGESTSGENSDDKNTYTDAPDELLPDEKNDTPDTGGGDSVITTGTDDQTDDEIDDQTDDQIDEETDDQTDDEIDDPSTDVLNGKLGEDLEWELTGEKNSLVLTISGSGSMAGISSWPWDTYRDSIISVIIGDGVSDIGVSAFENCSRLAHVSLPDSITAIGDWAFYNCPALGELNLPKQLESVGKWAFAGCWGIKELIIPVSSSALGSYAFLDCRNLKVIETTRNLDVFGDSVFDGCDDQCVMYGERGSAAHLYAKNNGITFIDRRYDLSNAIVTGIETKVWKKAGVTQSPTVILNGEVLQMGTDYTLSYRNNRDVGYAEVRISGTGDYDGFCSRRFKIKPKMVTGLKLTAGSRELKASWKEEKWETLSGYELQYSTSSSFKNDTDILTIGKSSTPWKRVTKLKAGTTYYVRVRAFRKKGANMYRSKWSAAQKVKTLK